MTYFKSLQIKSNIFNYAYIKVILVIVTLVLPLNIISIMQNSGTIDAMIEQARLTTQNLSDNYMNETGSKMQNTQSLLVHFLQEDVDCMRMKEQGDDPYIYESAKMRFYYNLKTMGSMINGADGYFYLMEKKNDILVWGNQVKGEKIQETMSSSIWQMLGDNQAKGWHINEINGRPYLVLLVKGKDIAYGGWIELNPILTQIEKGIEYKKHIVTFYEKEKTKESRNEIRVASEKRGIVLDIRIPRAEVTGRLSVYQRVLRVMVLIYLVLIPALYFFLRYLLLNPLDTVNEAHRQLRNGNQDYRIGKKAKSVEYQEVYISFNQMADELKTLKIESYEKEIARQKMELQNLQLQIRPHFLLNTFNLIYTLAQRGDNCSIQEVVLYLSDYFRYIFRSHKELELFSKELQMIQGYIRMASIRYLDQIQFECNMDPELSFVRTPPLLIHNFIENAVKYGIKQGEILHITLNGEYERGKVTFYIIDDGNGMDEETLEREERLIHGIDKAENPNAHIGLVNSMKRLKYFYGEEASLEMESEPGQFMCFKIEFPYNLEDKDEFTDC